MEHTHLHQVLRDRTDACSYIQREHDPLFVSATGQLALRDKVVSAMADYIEQVLICAPVETIDPYELKLAYIVDFRYRIDDITNEKDRNMKRYLAERIAQTVFKEVGLWSGMILYKEEPIIQGWCIKCLLVTSTQNIDP